MTDIILALSRANVLFEFSFITNQPKLQMCLSSSASSHETILNHNSSLPESRVVHCLHLRHLSSTLVLMFPCFPCVSVVFSHNNHEEYQAHVNNRHQPCLLMRCSVLSFSQGGKGNWKRKLLIGLVALPLRLCFTFPTVDFLGVTQTQFRGLRRCGQDQMSQIRKMKLILHSYLLCEPLILVMVSIVWRLLMKIHQIIIAKLNEAPHHRKMGTDACCKPCVIENRITMLLECMLKRCVCMSLFILRKRFR